MPNDTEYFLTIEKEQDSNDWVCYYYMISHRHRSIFWMNEYAADSMLAELDGVTDPGHISG
jgi:hypothetical protein